MFHHKAGSVQLELECENTKYSVIVRQVAKQLTTTITNETDTSEYEDAQSYNLSMVMSGEKDAYQAKEENALIQEALNHLENEIPKAFPPKVNEKPVVRLSDDQETIEVSFIPQNELYSFAKVLFDFNTKTFISATIGKQVKTNGLEITAAIAAVNYYRENEDVK